MRFAALWLAPLALGSCGIWGGLARWYQAPGAKIGKSLSVLLWAAFCIGLSIALHGDRTVLCLLTFAAVFGGLLFWWGRLAPSNDRNWLDDVAQMTAGEVEGNRVTLHNVRNFDWRTNTDFTQRWETRRYDLERLCSLDMIMSYWTIPAIAHMLISFGFDDGEHVVFSVEIRREKHEKYSEVGGFFKEFELSIIAADERDVIRVRTNVRGEDAYLHRILGSAGREPQLVPRLHFGSQCAADRASLLQHHNGQLHHACVSHDAAHRRLPTVELSSAVFRLPTRVRLPRRRPRPSIFAAGAA
jgi:hypothetical protein